MNCSSLNGQKVDSLSLKSRAAQYGDGVFRTMLVSQRSIWLRELQLQTLINDAKAIGLTPPDRDRLNAQLLEQAAQIGQGVMKASLIAQDTARGYARASDEADLLLQCSALPEHIHSKPRTGVRLACVDYRLSANPRLAGIKHLNRLDQVLARRKQAPGFDEALVQHPHGGWISGVMSNLFWHIDGRWHTPRIELCGINGVVRQSILRWLEEQQSPVQLVTAASQAALQQADMICVSNSLIGLMPVAHWQHQDGITRRDWGVDFINTFQPFQNLIRALNHPFSHE